MYVLQISPKAFIKLEDKNMKVVRDPADATKFNILGDAMREASCINNDWDNNIVTVLKLEWNGYY